MTDTSYLADKQILKKKKKIAVSSTESITTLLHRNYSAKSATLYLLPRKDI